MLVSHEHKFIFIHVPKTGGSAIRAVFPGEPPGNRSIHRRLTTLRGLHADYFSWGFVRNPWDRMCSLYHYFAGKSGNEDIKQWGFKKVLLENRFESGSNDCCWYLTGVQDVCRFEKFQIEIDRICDQIGIARRIVPKKNASAHEDYRTYYDNEMIDFVSERHKASIERFGYTFEDTNRV